MGRTARRPGPPTFLFGVWGEGETSQENIDALLAEFIEGLGDVTPRFLIPLDKEITTDTHLAVVTFAEDNKYEIEVVQAAAPRTKALREVKEIADKVHEADDDKNPIESVFAEALAAREDNARLLFLWAEDKDGEPIEDDQRVLFACIDKGVVALDLTQGLDVLGADGGDAGGDKGGDDDKGNAEPEPDEAEVREWSIRRVRTYALDVAEAKRQAKEKDVPDEDTIEEWGKDALLAWLYPENEPEPEKPTRSRRGSKSTEAAPEDGDKGVTPRRAREMREEAEAEGTDSTTRNRRRGAARAAEEPEDGADAGGEGEDTAATASEALSSLREGIDVLMDDKATDDEVADAIEKVAESFADYLIDRIAARVEKEPEGSAIRKEVSPPRPPGKPRKDGATPTRRRTRA